jgi:hypothetical protein
MAANDPELTLALRAHISGLVHSGASPEAAAAAAGVPPHCFRRWLARGRGRRGREPYRAFAAAIQRAEGAARVRAEIKAWEDDPRLWLRYGPGRKRPGAPGWGQSAPAGVPRPDPGSYSAHEVECLVPRFMEALEPFPEARRVAADALGPAARANQTPRLPLSDPPDCPPA